MVKEEAQARTTKVASYICKSEYMDKTYGEGMRVFNSLPKESPSFRVGRNWAVPEGIYAHKLIS
jgi:hypothetical protein